MERGAFVETLEIFKAHRLSAFDWGKHIGMCFYFRAGRGNFEIMDAVYERLTHKTDEYAQKYVNIAKALWEKYFQLI